MAKGYALSRANLQRLRSVTKKVKQTAYIPRGRPSVTEPVGVTGADRYVAYLPATINSAIGLIKAPANSAPAVTLDSQLLQIYQSVNGQLKAVAGGAPRRVYNLSQVALVGPKFIPVWRDKFGAWYTDHAALEWDTAYNNAVTVAADTVTIATLTPITAFNITSTGTSSDIKVARRSSLMLWALISFPMSVNTSATVGGFIKVSGIGTIGNLQTATYPNLPGLSGWGFQCTVGPVIWPFVGGEEIEVYVYHQLGGVCGVNFYCMAVNRY